MNRPPEAQSDLESLEEAVERSPRIHSLVATALEALAPLYGMSLSREDAKLLADVGSVRAALEKLRAKTQVRRGAPGVAPLSAQGQQSIAVAEVIAEHRGVHLTTNARRDFRVQLVHHQSKFEQMRREQAEATAAVENMLRKEERQSAELRKFLRHVVQQRTTQRNRLRAEIAYPEVRDGALERLDQIYEQVLLVAFGG